jgi:hypothetical protein
MNKYKFSFVVQGKNLSVTPAVEIDSEETAVKAFSTTLKLGSFISTDQGVYVRTNAIEAFELAIFESEGDENE